MLGLKLVHVSKRVRCDIWPRRTRLNEKTLSRQPQQRTQIKVKKHDNSKSESTPNVHFTNCNVPLVTLWYIHVDSLLQRINPIVEHTITLKYLEMTFGTNPVSALVQKRQRAVKVKTLAKASKKLSAKDMQKEFVFKITDARFRPLWFNAQQLQL